MNRREVLTRIGVVLAGASFPLYALQEKQRRNILRVYFRLHCDLEGWKANEDGRNAAMLFFWNLFAGRFVLEIGHEYKALPHGQGWKRGPETGLATVNLKAMRENFSKVFLENFDSMEWQ